MKLTIYERISVDYYIPAEGHYADMAEVRKLKELLAFTGEEIEQFEIKGVVGADGKHRLNWNDAKAATYLKDIPFTEWITKKVQTSLIYAEMEGKLPIEHLTLYEKFITLYRND